MGQGERRVLRVWNFKSLPMASLTLIKRFASFALPELYQFKCDHEIKIFNLYAMQEDIQRPKLQLETSIPVQYQSRCLQHVQNCSDSNSKLW